MQLVGILVCIVEPAHHEIGTRPDICGNGSLRANILPASLSMRTSTPVASVNFLVFASQASSSPYTKGVQRSRRRLAPFSGVYFGSAAKAGLKPKPERRLPLPGLRFQQKCSSLDRHVFSSSVIGTKSRSRIPAAPCRSCRAAMRRMIENRSGLLFPARFLADHAVNRMPVCSSKR